MMRLTSLAFLGAVAFPQVAAAQEQRSLTVASGQQFDATIVATEDAGFRVRLAQGELVLPFEAVVGFDALPEGRTTLYNTPWQVLLLVVPSPTPLSDGPSHVALARAAFEAVPDVRVQLVNDLEPAVRDRVLGCAADVLCVARQLPSASWTFVSQVGGTEAALDYRTVSPLDLGTGAGQPVPRAGRVMVSRDAPEGTFSALRASLGLVDDAAPSAGVRARLASLWPEPEPEPVVVEEPPVLAPVTVAAIQPTTPVASPSKPATVPDPPVSVEDPDAVVVAQPAIRAPDHVGDTSTPKATQPRAGSGRDALWSLIPVPGLAAARDQRWGAFGGALATTAAVGAGWVAVSGSFSTDKAEHIGLAVGGTYLASIASSELFRQLGAKGVVLAPAPVSGARGVEGVAVTVGGRF
jgi:hypothetical protein